MRKNKKKYGFWRRPLYLLVRDKTTLEKKYGQTFTVTGVVVIFLLMMILLIALGVVITFLTPLKYQIPGYGSLDDRIAYKNLLTRIKKLEERNQSQELYINNLSRILTGEVETVDTVSKPTRFIEDTILIVDRISEDEDLRKTIQASRISTQLNQNTSPVTSLEEIYLHSPVTGMVSRGYDELIKHFGIDIIATKNTPINSVLPGRVILADWTTETGHTIAIQHKNNLTSIYKHNSSLLKKEGDYVEAGEAIAIIGNSGEQTDGPHLHFELWYNGSALDPLNYLDYESSPF